jgi:hypothetical protein
VSALRSTLLVSLIASCAFSGAGCDDSSDSVLLQDPISRAPTDAGTPHTGDPVPHADSKVNDATVPRTVCATIASQAIEVTIRPGGAFACDNIEVSATDGTYRETLKQTRDCVFAGVGGRTGTYQIVAQGYGRVLATEAVVTQGECSAITERRTFHFNDRCTAEHTDAGTTAAATIPSDAGVAVPITPSIDAGPMPLANDGGSPKVSVSVNPCVEPS